MVSSPGCLAIESEPSSSALLPLFCVFFFVSGACGLAYEILWTRLFGLAIGNVAVTLSAVLTAFMGGLALGSWLAGRLWPRLRNPLAFYGWLELGIAASVLLLPSLIRLSRIPLAAVYRTEGLGPHVQHVARFLAAGAIMITPATFMGATLPALIGFFSRSRNEVGQRTGLLYAVNTFGAMAGATATGLYLIPRVGLSRIAWGAAALNALIGFSALAVSRGKALASGRPQSRSADSETTSPLGAAPGAAAVPICVASIALSGAASMLLQVAWTRLFALMIGSSTYSFTLVVVATIGSLALGAHIFGRMADRASNPGALLAGLLAVAGFSVFATVYLTNQLPLVIYRLLGRALDRHAWILTQEFCLIGLLLFGTTFCLGGTFPAVARIAARQWSTIGGAVGAVYAVNTIGAVAGAALAGLALMPILTLRGCVVLGAAVLVALGAIVALAVLRRRWLGALAAFAMAAAFVAALRLAPSWDPVLLTSNPYLRQRFVDQEIVQKTVSQIFQETVEASKLLFYREGLACTVTVVQYGSKDQILLKVNGKTDASNSGGDMPTQLLVGHLACLFHPNPQDGCIIGLGGGYSLGAMETYPMRRIDCVEISKDVVDAVRLCFEPYNGHALQDPRAHVIIADGRNHLGLTDRTYDVIVSEPSNPWIAGVGSLFTTEFFQLARSRLAPGGILGQWIHMYSLTMDDVFLVIGSFLDVFGPNVILWQCSPGDYILLGSNGPLRLDWDRLGARLADPRIGASLERQGLNNVRAFLSGYVGPGAVFAKAVEGHPRNTDDSPRLEFSAPASLYRSADTDTVRQLAPFWSPIEPLFEASAASAIPPDQRSWMVGHVSRKQRFAQAEALVSTDEAGKGMALLLDILKENPDDLSVVTASLESLLALGVGSARSGDPALAVRVLETADQLCQQHGNALKDSRLSERIGENLAWALLQEGQSAKALETFEKLFAEGSGSTYARLKVGGLLVANGEVGRALPVLLDGLKEADSSQYESLLGLADYAAAAVGAPAALGPALQNDPSRSPPVKGPSPLAAAMALTEPAKAGNASLTDESQSALKWAEKDPFLAAAMGEALRLGGQTSAARSFFKASLEARSKNPAALLGLAQVFLQSEPPDIDAAQEALEQARPLSVGNPRHSLLMALAAEARGDLDKARLYAAEAQDRTAALPEVVAKNWFYADTLKGLLQRINA